MYDTEESATRLAFGQLATRMYDTEEREHGWQIVICLIISARLAAVNGPSDPNTSQSKSGGST